MTFIVCFLLFVFVTRLLDKKRYIRSEDAFVCIIGILICLYTLFEHMSRK